MAELLFVNIWGDDRPGMMAELTGLLAVHGAEILDIGQSVIHQSLSLCMLVRVPGGYGEVPAALEAYARETETSIRVSPLAEDDYHEWVALQGQPRYILTLLARRITAEQLAAISGVVTSCGLNIDTITRLSGRVPLTDEVSASKACIELTLKGMPEDTVTFRQQLMAASQGLDVDAAVQEDTLFRRHRRLVAFDMDSTLITAEVIDELAREAGVYEKVSAVTERAMRGELDFTQSLNERVGLLKGLPESVLENVAGRLPLTEGAEHLFATLNRLGYRTAILSGGFTYFAQRLQARLGIDHVFANELEIEAGTLTGRVIPPVVDADRKASLLRELAAQEGISLEQVIAVGDGANDLAMLATAGLGIAFHAKPLVRESAGHAISNLGLDGILYLMGIRDRDAGALSD